MDRSEAYNVLAEEMTKLTQLRPDQLTALCENTVEIDRHGASSTLYSVELSVEQKASELFVIVGSIHDNSGYRFSLLKERLELDFTEEN